MSGGFFTYLSVALLGTMLLIAAVSDLRHRIIPNWLNLAIALTAPLAWWGAGLSPWPDIALQIGAALAVFAFFTLHFALGGMGGGDVKLLGALALWIDASLLLPLLLLMSIFGGIIAAVMLVQMRLRKTKEKPELPYGVAIAAAGLWALYQQYINHFALPPII